MFPGTGASTLSTFLVKRCLKSELILLRRRSSGPTDVVTYCMENVKKYDYEGYLCTLLLPRTAISSCFVLRAFNIELAQVRDLVSDNTIGQMRFQFWRDVVEEAYEGKSRHSPVAVGLRKVVEKHHLTKRWLLRLIEGREQHFNTTPFSSLQDVDDYSEKSNSSINYLILETLGVRDLNADHAASHSGKCQGITTLLRGIPYTAKNHRTVLLPMDLMIKFGVSQQDIVRVSKEQKVKDLIFDVASEANAHLEMARSFKDQIPHSAKTALLSNVSSDSYLKSLQKADFDIFHPGLQQRNGWLLFQLWLTKLKNAY